jgi:8-oxo-dGTP diphosphatase
MPKSDQGIDVSLKRRRFTVIPRTLVFITRGDRILLLRGSSQKRSWANKFNGIGGHIERDEDVYAAARREVREETALEVEDLRLVGLINIDGDQPTGIMLFVFTATSRSGDPIPTEEGTPEWIARAQLAQIDLVEDLPTILPRALDLLPNAPPFFCTLSLDEQERLIIRFTGD